VSSRNTRENRVSCITPSIKSYILQGILPDGQEIAVKKLLEKTGHGLQELHNEVLLLAELQHKNLVRLQGYCSHRSDTLLVYEYISNGSLDNFLFGIFHFTNISCSPVKDMYILNSLVS
jgi:serine/threonine protein kinase